MEEEEEEEGALISLPSCPPFGCFCPIERRQEKNFNFSTAIGDCESSVGVMEVEIPL